MKRVKKNDPDAMCQMGGVHGKEGDCETALGYLTKAAELGNAGAHYSLSMMYHMGHCVEKDAEKKFITWKNPQLQVIIWRGTILDVKRRAIADSREQGNISSSPPTSDIMNH